MENNLQRGGKTLQSGSRMVKTPRRVGCSLKKGGRGVVESITEETSENILLKSS